MVPSRLFVVIAIAGVSVSSAQAQVSLQTAERLIRSGPVERAMSGFGPWSDSVSYRDPEYDGGGGASQMSSITSSRVTITSNVSGYDGRQISGGGGFSTLRLVFNVTRETEFHARTSFTVGPFFFGPPQVQYRTSLTGPSGTVYERLVDSGFDSTPYGTTDFSTVLTPGTYTFDIRHSIYAQATGGFSSPSGQLILDADVFLPAPSAGLTLIMGSVLLRRRRG